jgi:hypothetical protein
MGRVLVPSWTCQLQTQSWLSVLLVPSAAPCPTHRLQSQTPVVLHDEDILSDVVPSNIVSRQVSLFSLAARVFPGAEPCSSFPKDTPGDEVESEGSSEHQEQDELMSEDDGVRAVFRNLSRS